MKRIYIAGPYSDGDMLGYEYRFRNTQKAMQVATELLRVGYCPFVPHLNHFWDTTIRTRGEVPISYDTWMRWASVWLRQCEALLVLPGKSMGADREIAIAVHLAIPIYFDCKDLPAPTEKPTTV